MTEEPRKPEDQGQEAYEPPQVEDVPAEDRQAVTAAGATDGVKGPEWRAQASAGTDEPRE
jgi:hypothetical protein